jgi:hypothetical protein
MVCLHHVIITDTLPTALSAAASLRGALLQLIKRALKRSFQILQAILWRLCTVAVAPQPRPHAYTWHPSLFMMLAAVVLQQSPCGNLGCELQHSNIIAKPPHTRVHLDCGPCTNQEQ